MNLEEALKQLDPANDDHWTTDGSPRIDVLKDLMGAGGEGLKRGVVLERFPEFSRNNADFTPKPQLTDTVIAAPSAPFTPAPIDNTELPEKYLEDKEQVIHLEIAECERTINSNNKRIQELYAELDELKNSQAGTKREDPMMAYLRVQAGIRNALSQAE